MHSMKIIGRDTEQRKLQALMHSAHPELVAVYGRRRVGKTFLVSNTLRTDPDGILFEFTGSLQENGEPVSKNELLMKK